jgi:hypothetical protein
MNDEIPDGAVDHATESSVEGTLDASPETEIDAGAVEETTD